MSGLFRIFRTNAYWSFFKKGHTTKLSQFLAFGGGEASAGLFLLKFHPDYYK
jgi:hypothetical protein